MDDPYHRLIEIAKRLESFNSHDEVTKALDELEFVHELLAPEQQELAAQLTERLSVRIRRLGASNDGDG